ncbi:MAG TPA: NAD(P)/FAD-dependent oxidoreductase [Steroidobacteraceae bacterium]|jgi:phytoene dehydrogenase-like protein|nr:NAD(P)/FAD-dependent oxidoreductase [Steroidobacteraceae bacterium]
MAAPAPSEYDCIVIGGGHNGLVCAAYLAKSGRSVLVLEAAAQVGGAAVTREFAPGFRVSSCAHVLHLMPEAMIKELALGAHGLRLANAAMPTTALSPGAAPLALGSGERGKLVGAARVDELAYPRYAARLRRLARALQPMMSGVPPRLGTDAWSDRWSLLRLAWQVRRLGRGDMRELLRIIGMNVYDLLEEHFESPLLKGALAFDAVLGTNFGPRSPGTVLTLLYRMAAHDGSSNLAQPVGGLGAVSDALAQAAIAAGASIRTDAAVRRISVHEDRVQGVVLESGQAISADAVISSCDPKTTFLGLLGSEQLDTGFVRRVSHLRTRGLAAKLHLALEARPNFTGLGAEALAGRLLIAPSLEAIERAYNHAKYAQFSREPIFEITVPTLSDPTLAPPGKHVLSAIIQYVPYALASGWDGERQRFTDLAIDALERCAPGLRAAVRHAELLTPVDIEKQFRINGGHWHHVDLAFDQFFMVRPLPGAAQYRTPVAGLFLCGAGCHPGGGVMGAAGRNAARQVLKRVA